MTTTTLVALYRKPEGGEAAVAAFRRRYAAEHLPLIRQVPGLQSLHVAEVVQALGDSDLMLVARLVFPDRPTFDAALASDEMRAAGRNLREIAPGLVTMVVVEPDTELGASGDA
ncbi:MAG TPA: EthD family reductase [Candidatus Sulfotelmatobacter sp.]|nr:EthD family reductase [Candidatus Sulfotelmatobacter sp.]